MNIKIILLMILFIISINNVSASMEYVDSGEFDKSGVTQYTNYPSGIGAYGVDLTKVYFHDFSIYSSGLQFMSITTTGHYFRGTLKATYNSYFENIELKSGSNIIAEGKYGYYKTPGDNYIIYLWLDLDTWNNHGLSGAQWIDIDGISDSDYFQGWDIKREIPGDADSDTVMFGYNVPYPYVLTTEGGFPYHTNGVYSFYNSYDLYVDGTFQLINYSRDSNNQSIINIKDYNSNNLYTETVLDNEITEISSYNLSPWYLTVEDSFGNMYYDTLNFDIDVDAPTLTTDKTYYTTNENIEISYTNIDKLYENNKYEHVYQKPYELYILYPVIEDYKQYKAKFIQPLYYDLRDESFILNTSFLHPQNVYTLGIVGINGDYTQHEDILIFSDSFVVYPDDEYLSLSCESDSGCTTSNKNKITIYYKINNNSEIIIKDNDNNIIHRYYNIINEGEIVYTIPDDIEHLNTYPNWKIYLNNTNYPTSFNKGVTVYWSLFAIPTPTPTFTPQPTPDINISDEINNLKDEISPIKDLIIGLSGILIDNPDYNKDNIVDENEINHWFNSLIPMCILFLLLVLYIGLKKQRE